MLGPQSPASNKSISVLIPDGESHLLNRVINGLAQVKGIKIYIMSYKKNNAMRYSRYVHKFSYYPNTNSNLDWIANINKEIEKHDIDLVMPIWEVGIKTLITHRDKILFKERLGLMPSLFDFNTAINKGLLSAHLDAFNIPNPKSVLVESIHQLDNVDTLQFPILIKPLEGFGGGHGIRKFNTKVDVESYMVEKNIDYKLIVQEYIEGYDIDCSVLCKEGNILAFTIQKGNMIDASEFAPQIGLDFLYEHDLYKVVEKLMESLHWSGVAHIDMRYDKNDNQFKVIEVNPRFWMSLNASQIAGINFTELYCRASLNEEFKKPEYEYLTYLNLKGLVKKIKLDKKFILRLGFIFNNTPLKFVLKDPLPTIYKLISKEEYNFSSQDKEVKLTRTWIFFCSSASISSNIIKLDLAFNDGVCILMINNLA